MRFLAAKPLYVSTRRSLIGQFDSDCSPPDTDTTPTNPGGLRADSSTAATPAISDPITITLPGSASGRFATSSMVACRSSAAAFAHAPSEAAWHVMGAGFGPSDWP